MADINEFQIEDYLATARTRVTEQFKDKEVFDKYIQLLIYGATQLQEQWKILMQHRSLDTAEGAQLDLIGELVGLSRGTIPATILNDSYFGFEGVSGTLPFDDLDEPVDAGVFFDLANQTSGNVTWDDITFRMFIKAKIYANSSNGTYEEVMRAIKDILQVTSVDIIELGNANIQISFNKLLTNVEQYILTQLGGEQALLPIPIGVGVEYVESPEEFFGFEETPGALGFSSFEAATGYGEQYGYSYGGDASVEVGGGYFASLIV